MMPQTWRAYQQRLNGIPLERMPARRQYRPWRALIALACAVGMAAVTVWMMWTWRGR